MCRDDPYSLSSPVRGGRTSGPDCCRFTERGSRLPQRIGHGTRETRGRMRLGNPEGCPSWCRVSYTETPTLEYRLRYTTLTMVPSYGQLGAQCIISFQSFSYVYIYNLTSRV